MGEPLEQGGLLRIDLVAKPLEALDYVLQGLFGTFTSLLVMLVAYVANLGRRRDFACADHYPLIAGAFIPRGLS